MPTYTMKNIETDEISEVTLKMAEREQYLADNPHLIQILTSTAVLDSVRLGIRKPDAGFRDVLQKARNAHYKSTIDIK